MAGLNVERLILAATMLGIGQRAALRNRENDQGVAQEKPSQGEIVAVGPGRFEKDKRVPMEVKVGDKVSEGSAILTLESAARPHGRFKRAAAPGPPSRRIVSALVRCRASRRPPRGLG